MYPIWALSLYILLGSADSITAYSLVDHLQTNRLVYRFLPDVLFVVLLALTTSSASRALVIVLLFAIASLKVVHRVCASQLALCSWNLNKMVADYMDMDQEHNYKGSGSYDPVSMEGYHYLVDWPLRDSKLEADTAYAAEFTKASDIIDIERVFLSKDEALTLELKDACLSFSLCHLLRRRFYGFVCREPMQQQAHDFVFKGLLRKNDGSLDYQRVFSVIDIELAFMYDFFFTKHAVLYYGSWAAPFWSLASASVMFVSAYLTAIKGVRISTNDAVDLCFLFSTSTLKIDFLITLVILGCIVLLEVAQQLSFWTSIWGRVSFVCQSVRSEEASNGTRGGCSCSCMGFLCIKFKEILARIGVHVWRGSSYWQHKLGQYSLLESVDTTPSATNSLISFQQSAVTSLSFVYLLDFAAIHHPLRDGRRALSVRKPGEPVDLSPQVKEALVRYLDARSNEGGVIKLTNGSSSLYSNGAGHLAWACGHLSDGGRSSSASHSQRNGNQVYQILTWHIATCYCEMASVRGPIIHQQVHLDVATKLSRYCAYLVVCAPKLLPGNHYDTTRVFDAVAVEAMGSLRGQKDKYDAMRRLPMSGAAAPGSREKIFEASVRLGRELEQMEAGTRWKVLADFWTEMMLYVAPSGDAKQHVEFLAKGGEFVTHLWALLFHAGIGLQQDAEDHHV
jgi:hypothetical protein